MKLLSLFVAVAITALGQTGGTVNVVTTVTITSTAGAAPSSVSCSFTGNPTVAQITINCTGAGATLNSTLPLPLPVPGTVGNFGLSGNTITWAFVPWTSTSTSVICPSGTTSGTCWQVVANGTSKTGAF